LATLTFGTLMAADPSPAAAGISYPIGAIVTDGGTNFCVYAKHASRVELLLFDRDADAVPSRSIVLDPIVNKTYDYWHVFVAGIGSGQLYGYRVTGPSQAQAGLQFDHDKLLIDPYALAVANTENYSRRQAMMAGDNTAVAIKSVVVDLGAYDWEGDQPLARKYVDSLIYELHVGGFTRNPNSGVAADRRGTYLGLIDKIPYLVDLGIKTVELMPVQQFDPQAASNGVNYWGYQPVAWFAPHRGYCTARDLLAPVNEFRDLVKALHKAGIEVILDVVFNHTAEGDHTGPTLSLRGFDNPTYYLLDGADPARYIDDTGCGNTVNGNEPVVSRMILDCLRHWVEEMHVDGFRFDLAASLSRDERGEPVERPPLLLEIEADPVLAGATIIAEPWDAAGLYQLTNFAGDRWAVWNGQFRDNVRRFVKGDNGVVPALADNLVGSAQLFRQPDRLPCRSVNFVTAHDGFTLNDLVSYDVKHNEANGAGNQDGSDDNFSWNCGCEGPSDDERIEALRRRQIRNCLTILLLAEGRPMLLMGDEVRRTQGGNNNAYCQDNPLSWFDWDDLGRYADCRRFVRRLIHFRKHSPVFRDQAFWGQPGATAITWHGVRLNAPDWGDSSHALAYELFHGQTGAHMHVMLNAYWEPLAFDLPAPRPGFVWKCLVDTSRETADTDDTPPLILSASQQSVVCEPRSSVVLVSEALPEAVLHSPSTPSVR
jgi:glycogen operon protein